MTKNALLLLLGLALLNGCAYSQQSSMVFVPAATLDQTPAEWGFEYQDVFLETKDGERLHGWYIPHRGSKQTLLFFHGNGGNISHRGASVEIFHRLGLNVFIFDYRGYGKSSGEPDAPGLHKDARAAWHYLIDERELESKDIISFGRSLGGAVAANLATEVQPGGLILESTASYPKKADEVSQSTFPRYEFDTVANIKRVTTPVLILHSPDDEIIPLRLGEEVFQAANEPKSFVRMKGDHNNGFVMSQPEYERALGEFISKSIM